MAHPELTLFAQIFPAPSGDILLAALDDDAASLLEITGAGALAGAVPPWALVAWLRPSAVLPLLTQEALETLACRPPGQWLLVAKDRRVTLERIGE